MTLGNAGFATFYIFRNRRGIVAPQFSLRSQSNAHSGWRFALWRSGYFVLWEQTCPLYGAVSCSTTRYDHGRLTISISLMRTHDRYGWSTIDDFHIFFPFSLLLYTIVSTPLYIENSHVWIWLRRAFYWRNTSIDHLRRRLAFWKGLSDRNLRNIWIGYAKVSK